VTVRVSSRVLVFLPAAFLAGAFFGFSSAAAGVAGAGVLAGDTSGVSESVDGASRARVSAVIVAAISF
jgi:hypothetical protein